MKYLILVSLLTIAACDVPSAQRRQIFQTSGKPSEIKAPTNSLVPIPGTSAVGSIPTTPTSSATSSAGFETCALTPRFSNLAMGAMGFCQSTVDETQVKFQTTDSDTTSRTCLIPTYKDSTGSSTYIGDPQCTYTQAGKIYLGRLFKNRPGFESYPLTGLMIMKETLLPGYIDCMQSFTFYTQNRNCTYETDYRACMQQYGMQSPNAHQTCCRKQATNYQTLVCNTFKSNFANQYVDLRLK